DRTHLRRAVIVLAGGDVSTRAVKVNVRDIGRLGFAEGPGHTHKISADSAFAVIALGMSGVICDRNQWTRSLPKAHSAHIRIDDTLRRFASFRKPARAEPNVLHSAVRTEYTTIGGDFADLRASKPEVRDRLGCSHGGSYRASHPLDRRAHEGRIVKLSSQ